MEIAGSESVMRETIREVDRAIDLVQADHDAVVIRRLQAIRHQKMLHDRATELEHKARFAIGQERADLAEAAVIKQVDCEEEAEKLRATQDACQAEETRLAENLAALKARKTEMEQALTDFLGARRDAAAGDGGATRLQREVEIRVQNAEHAFRRAMLGAGGVDVGRTQAEVTNRVAAIDVMQKRNTVASRLAALFQNMASA
jgi:phage shock protein A